MKNIILLILFLVSIFVINIVFYYTSSDYRDFVKKVKNESNNVTEEKQDDFTIKVDNTFFEGDIAEKKHNNSEENGTSEDINNKNNTKNTVVKEEVKLGGGYQEILNLFSEYDLRKLEVNANLFDLTNEYPDSYYEFYSPKLTLYFFTTKNYNEVYDIFDVLQKELPFKINSTNNFGDKSFYINFNNDLNDAIRMVILYKGIVFGLKVDKNEYNKIKTRLQNLKNN